MLETLREWSGFEGRQLVAFALLALLLVWGFTAGVSNADSLRELLRAAAIALALPVVLVSHRLSSLFEGVSKRQEGAVMLFVGLSMAGFLAFVGSGTDELSDENLVSILGLYALLGVGQIVWQSVPTLRDIE